MNDDATILLGLLPMLALLVALFIAARRQARTEDMAKCQTCCDRGWVGKPGWQIAACPDCNAHRENEAHG